MKLMILGEKFPSYSERYRGIQRETLPIPSGENSIYWELIEKEDKYFMLDDLEFARQVIAEYEALDLPQHFEIVEITDDNEPPENAQANFLGFDVVQDYFISMLTTGLDFSALYDNLSDHMQVLVPLIRLVEVHFKPKLNEYGLFSSYEDASSFQQAVKALRILRPGLFEGGESIFEVAGLWLVSEENSNPTQ